MTMSYTANAIAYENAVLYKTLDNVVYCFKNGKNSCLLELIVQFAERFYIENVYVWVQEGYIDKGWKFFIPIISNTKYKINQIIEPYLKLETLYGIKNMKVFEAILIWEHINSTYTCQVNLLRARVDYCNKKSCWLDDE